MSQDNMSASMITPTDEGRSDQMVGDQIVGDQMLEVDAELIDQDSTGDLTPSGVPEAGYQALVNKGYVSCGIPESLSSLIDLGEPSDRIEGRNTLNEDMPYFVTKIEAPSGVRLIVGNCLTCHASYFNGDLIIGLGDVFRDYATDRRLLAQTALSAVDQILDTEAEIEEFTKFTKRSLAIAPYTQTKTIGVNPAISISAGIMTYLDPVTLSWSDTPVIETPLAYQEHVVGLNPPPWWWYKKKSKMFYSASGGGSHVAWSMLASSMCLDNEDQVREISRDFPDILAYLKTIEAPEYPWEIDEERAEEGERIFEQVCATCHGTYGLQWTYPERVIELDELNVDETMAVMMFEADVFHQWVNDSFFGLSSYATPKLGYVAPPLDGVWATAPYLHNGSIPTIEVLLKSEQRPKCWTWSYDSKDYDQDALGWRYEESVCQDEVSDDSESIFIYDTNHVGYGNQGHTYGDVLTDEERGALLEYIKTL